MAQTYEPITTLTASGGSTTQLVMSSIPATYTDLVLIINGTLSTASNCYIQFNGDTASNYSYTYLYGSGTAASSARGASQATGALMNYIGTSQSTTIMNFINYANTTTYKTSLSRSSNSTTGVMIATQTWRSTAAINSITVVGGGNFDSGTTFTLYGIKAA